MASVHHQVLESSQTANIFPFFPLELPFLLASCYSCWNGVGPLSVELRGAAKNCEESFPFNVLLFGFWVFLLLFFSVLVLVSVFLLAS